MATNSAPFPPGKLPADLLGKLLSDVEGHPRLLVGPRVGEDAAVIDMGDRCVIVKSDPITFAEKRIGWYAVHVNANDIACMGARPAWFLATLLLPERQTDESMVATIWRDIRAACSEIGATLCGGHTEITIGLSRPIVCGQMLGEAPKENIIRGEGAREGDAILLTRAVPVEGAAIMAEVKGDELAKSLGQDLIDRAKGYLDTPGLSVVQQALAAAATGHVHAMHDPTEGGLATGLHELAEAAGLGAVIDETAIPLSSEGEAMCLSLGLDPLGVITSGALLLAAAPEGEAHVRRALEESGALGVRIGTLHPESDGIHLRGNKGERPLPRYDSDEIGKIF
ncbi:MAG: hydrogenase expression protein [Nitrospinaceae bacterium]|jgi:hydrogenase expression/formation protein HypE|nr:hydrogenase expression protein [Nitrospinaceae bacterium]MBT3433523.1 hydrogenase expression protein [Nitrospinaceae bacterium]MBT3822318.1 hydrogenase expression protein [Nitrospinaceae bacterium]MBT4092825.1 hydrogenase expression protein [Nitrospinaceae bacterium]MBT4430383.1 hydrogenase expression protein [Nitrospinaceae bacterium]